MSTGCDVSVIIVNWNTRDLLRNCLHSLYTETRDISFEVIVVDNASSDESVQMVRDEFSNTIVIENKENRGFAAANNQAMRLSKGRFVLLLNADTVILDGAIQKCIAYADLNADAGVIGCKAVYPNGGRQNTCLRYPSILIVIWGALVFFREAGCFQRSRLLHPDRYLHFDFEQEHDVDMVAGCFFLVRRSVVDQVGVFDEDFFMYGEEAEWCYRVRTTGWRVRYFPGASIIHIHGASSVQVDGGMQANKRVGTLLVIDKTKGFLWAWIANAIMLIGVFVRLPFWVAIRLLDVSGIWRTAAISAPQKENHLIAILKLHAMGLIRPIWRLRHTP